MSRRLSRREMMLAAGAAALGASAYAQGAAAASFADRKKVLFFTKSSGFQHSVITRKGQELSHAEKILTELGEKHGYDVVCSKDGTVFNPGSIEKFDAFVFETTGDLTKPGPHNDGPPMSPEGEKALHEAIRSGKGFLGIHCATDTFGPHRGRGADDPYIQMIGGQFGGHGAQQVARLEVASPSFPGAKALGSKSFEITDEWYNNINLGDDLHVIYAHVTEGMKGADYDRPNYPETWARRHGKGRVFYTSMGHREDVWANPKFQELLTGALAWVTGKVDAEVAPNVSSVTPGYKTVPPKNRPK
ncbi:MAG: ThuA domain-containing protein [Isosphaeraceae bacterium]